MNWLKKIFGNKKSVKRLSAENTSNTKEQSSIVFDAWTSGDLGEMIRATKSKSNPIDRHFLLLQIVEETYKKRKDIKYREIFKEFAQQHISEFSALSSQLKKEFNNKLPRVPTFQKYSTVLAEDLEFSDAVEVCEMALRIGLDDGTKSGFRGRIERIKKKQGF